MDKTPFFDHKFSLANLSYTKSQQQAVRAFQKTHTLSQTKMRHNFIWQIQAVAKIVM